MKCPNCGIINPPTAQRCDCGYNFEQSPPEKAPAVTALVQESRWKFVLKTVAYFFLVWFLLILLGAGIRDFIGIITGIIGFPVVVSQGMWAAIALFIALVAVGMHKIRLVIVASLVVFALSIALAVAMPYYLPRFVGISDTRSACDTAARRDVDKLQTAMSRLEVELMDINVLFDENAVERIVAGNALKYFAGPYYLWDGCSKKCEVVVRLTKANDRWAIEGAAVKGSQPSGPQSRHVFRSFVTGGGELTPIVVHDIIDAKDGNARNWNSYPAPGPSSPEACYGESLVEQPSTDDKPGFRIRVPRALPCQQAGRANR